MNIKYNGKNILNIRLETLSKLLISITYKLDQILLSSFVLKYIDYINKYDNYTATFCDKPYRQTIKASMEDRTKKEIKKRDTITY